MSQTAKKESELNFGLQTLELIDLQLSHPEKPLDEKTIFNFNIEINQKFNVELEAIFNICRITINIEDNTTVGMIRSSLTFSVPNLKDYVTEKNELTLPQDLIVAFNSISISTTRGMLFSELKGTFLHNALLPLIDPKGLTK